MRWLLKYQHWLFVYKYININNYKHLGYHDINIYYKQEIFKFEQISYTFQ